MTREQQREILLERRLCGYLGPSAADTYLMKKSRTRQCSSRHSLLLESVTEMRPHLRHSVSPLGSVKCLLAPSPRPADCVTSHISSSRLALLTLTSNGFGNSADTGAGLALALLVVSSNTAYTASAYNVTGFSSYLFMPYHDVLEGTQSVLAFVCLVLITSLFHVALVTAMSLSMFYTMGIGGGPLMLPTFVVGVFLWVLGVFGFITLIMGLETLFNSCSTGRIMHADEITARRHQLPVSPLFPFSTPSLLRCWPMFSLSMANCSSLVLSRGSVRILMVRDKRRPTPRMRAHASPSPQAFMENISKTTSWRRFFWLCIPPELFFAPPYHDRVGANLHGTILNNMQP